MCNNNLVAFKVGTSIQKQLVTPQPKPLDDSQWIPKINWPSILKELKEGMKKTSCLARSI